MSKKKRRDEEKKEECPGRLNSNQGRLLMHPEDNVRTYDQSNPIRSMSRTTCTYLEAFSRSVACLSTSSKASDTDTVTDALATGL